MTTRSTTLDLVTRESEDHLDSGVLRVVARGEIDFDSAELLSTRLTSLIDHGAVVVVLDTTDVTFLDSSGLRVIIAAANRLRALGGQLFIEGMSGAVQRVLEITGLLDRLAFGEYERSKLSGVRASKA
jgi:anti-sigma B factor antagonist